MTTELDLKLEPQSLTRFQRRPRPATGMSLLELLLVMAVLSTVVAIAWPALRRPLNRSHVQSAAQQLQRDLLAARRAAMESGQVHWFQYQPDSGRYYCGVHRQFDSQGSPAAEDIELTQPSESENSFQQLDRYAELPVGTSFLAPESSSRQRELRRTDSGARTRDDSTSSGSRGSDRIASDPMDSSAVGGWSRPLRFYPSGRMESGQLSLSGEDGYDIQVEIQGLAGRVRIHPPERNDDEQSDESGGEEDTDTERRSPSTPRNAAGSGRSRSAP